MLTGQVVSEVSCSALNSWRTLLSYNPDCSPLRASGQLSTDLTVQEELAFAAPADLLELLLLATRCVCQGTVAKADYCLNQVTQGGKGTVTTAEYMHPRAPREQPRRA